MRRLPALAAAAAALLVGGSAAAADCVLQGFDDRCEAFVSLYNAPNNNPDDGYEDIRDMVLSPDGGRVYAVGISDVGPDSANFHYDYSTVAFDASNGAILWTQAYDGPSEAGQNYAHGIAVSPDGTRVFATGGEGTVALQQGNYGTVAYDAATGDELWRAVYDFRADGIDLAYDAAVTPDGSTLFVTGQSRGYAANPSVYNYDAATVAYDAETGEQRWAARFDGKLVDGFEAYDIGERIEVAPDGSTLYVSGFGNTGDAITIAYDAETGTERWQAAYDNGDFDFVGDSTLSPDGSTLYVSGGSDDPNSPQLPRLNDADAVTVAYDSATGDERWVARDRAMFPQGDAGLSIAAADDRVYVAGQTTSAPLDLDWLVVAYDAATGTQVWRKQFDGPLYYDETARALTLSPDGQTLYVVGEAADGFTHSWATTRAVDAATGIVRWIARYGISPDGLVYHLPKFVVANGTRVLVGTMFQYFNDQGGEHSPLEGDRVALGLIGYDP